MPVFDLECPVCGALHENVLLRNDDRRACPTCGAECRQLMGAPSFKVNGHNAENGYARKQSVLDNPPR